MFFSKHKIESKCVDKAYRKSFQLAQVKIFISRLHKALQVEVTNTIPN